jgi:GNAT superfamily N-acetyltransferase
MELEFKRFSRECFAEYAAWFVDAELNRWLGPMDEEWLECVLGEDDSEGETWAVFRDAELVAVVECVFPPSDPTSPIISALATKPALRRQGIGAAALQHLLALHRSRGIAEHGARIAANNAVGLQCAVKAGFVLVSSEPDQHGYVDLRRRT